MDYLVDFTIVVPEGTADEELERRVSGEGARVAELAADGHALRVWRPVPDDGRWRAVGLYRAAEDAELDRILASTPNSTASWRRCHSIRGWRSRCGRWPSTQTTRDSAHDRHHAQFVTGEFLHVDGGQSAGH
jgi:muconolactone D-isomerase